MTVEMETEKQQPHVVVLRPAAALRLSCYDDDEPMMTNKTPREPAARRIFIKTNSEARRTLNRRALVLVLFLHRNEHFRNDIRSYVDQRKHQNPNSKGAAPGH